MNVFKKAVSLAVLVAVAALPVFSKTKKIPADADFWSDYPDDQLADFLVERMSDEELLSQILMFGWAGQMPSDLLLEWVSDKGLGSVKVFGWNTDNIRNVARSVSQLQTKAKERSLRIPLFVATDQEGGWIRHVKGETSETPGNMAIGASSSLMDAYNSAFYINREIRALGINMNFAPTVDIYSNLDSTVIGPRSFSSDPEVVGRLGEAFCLGTQAAGVIPTAKHFPGHGDTNLDSHGRLPQIRISKELFYSRELVPYKYLVKAKVPAIMSGHLSFPSIDPSGAPASLSKVFLTDLLRNELGYEGLIITDDMMMNGAIQYAGSTYNAFHLAIEAGNDIIISSSTASLTDQLWTRNLQDMERDKKFKSQVKNAARRVILSKLKYFKSDNAAPLYPDEDSISQFIPDKEGQKFFLSQACRATTLYTGTLPYTQKSGERLLIASPYNSFLLIGKKHFPRADTYNFTNDLMAETSDGSVGANLAYFSRDYDTVIVNVYNDQTAQIASRLKNTGKKVIVLSSLSPVPVLDFDWADTILLGYSYSDFSFDAMFGALNGEYVPQGKLPLDLN